MRDDFLTRDWAENHQRVTADIDKLSHRLIKAVGDTFDSLYRVQFDAPWRRPIDHVCVNGSR